MGDDFRVSPWPRLRDTVVHACENARPHVIYAASEVDMTDAFAKIGALRRATRVAVSVHAFVLGCVAKAAIAHPMLHAFRQGNKLITFDTLDVGTIIDQHTSDVSRTRLPVVHIVRDADRKSIAHINWEIRRAARSDLGKNPDIAFRRGLTKWPAPIRRVIFRYLLRDPWMHRRFFGTLGFTSAQSPGFNHPLYTLVPNMQGATIAMGNIHQKFLPDADGNPVLRRVLNLSGTFDHDLVDGMTLSRFALSVTSLIESGYGLDDEFIQETKNLAAREMDAV